MKKYLMTLFLGFAIFLIGISWFYIETMNYGVSDSLTSNFNMEKELLKYEINYDDTFKITNYGTDKNMKLFIDNSLSNEVRIVISHSDMMNMKVDYYNDHDVVNIDFKRNLNPNFNDIIDIYDLGIISLKNKTVYNYTLLKYPEVLVFVNENYKTNIKFIDSNGNEYNPIR